MTAINAPPTVISNIASVDGTPHIFFANFAALVQIAAFTAQLGVRTSIPTGTHQTLRALPFLKEARSVHLQRVGDRDIFGPPRLERGAVAGLRNRGRFIDTFPGHAVAV